MKRKSSTPFGSQKRKSSTPARKIEDTDVEKSHDEFVDNILKGFDLPALYQRAVSNVHAKIADMSAEEIEKAAELARARLSGKFNVVEELSETSDFTETKKRVPSVKKIKSLIKYPVTVGQAAFLSQIQLDFPEPRVKTESDKKGSILRSSMQNSGLVENVKKPKENASLGSRKSVVRRQSSKKGSVSESPTKQLRNSGLVENVKKSKENASLGSRKSVVRRQSSKDGSVSGSPTKQLRNSGLVKNVKKVKENNALVSSPTSVVKTQSGKNEPVPGSSTKRKSVLMEIVKKLNENASVSSPTSVVRTQSGKNEPVPGSSTKQLKKSGLVENMKKSKENNSPLSSKQPRARRPPEKLVLDTRALSKRIIRRRLVSLRIKRSKITKKRSKDQKITEIITVKN